VLQFYYSSELTIELAQAYKEYASQTKSFSLSVVKLIVLEQGLGASLHIHAELLHELLVAGELVEAHVVKQKQASLHVTGLSGSLDLVKLIN